MAVMRPAISEVICTLSSDCSVPMARKSSVEVAATAAAASTATLAARLFSADRPLVSSAGRVVAGCVSADWDCVSAARSPVLTASQIRPSVA
jgi:hypothetical protein